MPAIVKPKITDAGLAAAINAQANSLQLAITHVALGTGTYDSEANGAGMTAMAARTEFVQLGAGAVSGAGGLRVLAHFDAWTGAAYDVTELGFWAGEPGQPGSVLFAVYSSTTEVIVTRNLLDYIGSFTLQLVRVPPGSITVTIDPSAAQALALIALHEQATNPHPQYVRKSGDTSTGAQNGLTAPPHDNTTKFATTAFVKRQGVSFPASGGMAITGADVQLDVNDLGRWIDMQNNGGVLRLPTASDCPVGGAIAVRITALTGTIVAAGGDTLVTLGLGNVSSFPVASGDWYVITRNAGNTWWVTQQGSRIPVGMPIFMPTLVAPPGFIKVNGALLSRAAYGSLYSFAQASGLVTEAQWSSGYSGRFSSGNGSTNFRIPDSRGVHIQAFDDGRGLDSAGRPWGFFQASANKLHSHGVNDPGHNHALSDSGHSHSGSASTAGSHAHSGTAASAGSHSHSGTAESAGEHTHAGVLQKALNSPRRIDLNRVGGADENYGTGRNTGETTASAGWHSHVLAINAGGAHTHTLGIDPAGSHSHSISVGAAQSGIGIYSANAGISILGEGANRATPDNINWPLYMRYL